MMFMSYNEVSLLAEQNSAIMGHLGGIAEYKLLPPKEDLVDTVSFTLLDLKASSFSVLLVGSKRFMIVSTMLC